MLQVEPHLADGEELLQVTETDVTRQGQFGRRWVAVTDRRVLTFGADGPVEGPEMALELAEIRSVRSHHLVGQVALQAEVDGRRVELARGSNSMSAEFSRLAKALNDACEKGKKPEFPEQEEEPRHCPRCGRLLPEKGSFCPACLRKREVLSRFWRYMRRHLAMLLLAGGVIMVLVTVAVLPPLLVKVLVDEVLLGDGGRRLLLLLIAALVGARLVTTGLEMVRGRVVAALSARIVHDLRFDLYQAIQALTLKSYDKTQTGTLVSRLTHDTSRVNWFFIDVGVFFLPSVLQLVGILVMLFVLKVKLALWVMLPVPAVVLVTRWFYRRLRGLYRRVWQRHAMMSARATDSISGIRIVKAFSQEPKETDRFRDHSVEVADATVTAEAMWATGRPLIGLVMATGSFLVWYFGGLGVMEGDVTYGTLMAFLSYLWMFYGPLGMMTGFVDYINRSFTAAQRVFEVIDADQEVYEDPDAKPLPAVDGAIRFDEVEFGYVPDRPVLKGMKMDIQPGEMIGLVGRSGAGKTTVCNLICRFYDVDDGAVTLDGTDLRKLRLRDLRRHIGIVPQECFLFNGTIAENISYAKAGATRQEIIRAATAANAHGFIMRKPDGYDTMVGERGAHLSAGEKQRVAIARAILHNPKILILDEATSSVDTETEALIQEALGRLVYGRTTFAIAHRLSTLRNADRLLVIEDGKPAEVGTHEELMANKGTYQKLVEMQSSVSSVTGVGG